MFLSNREELETSIRAFSPNSRYTYFTGYSKISHGKDGRKKNWQHNTFSRAEILNVLRSKRLITGVGRLINRDELIIDVDMHGDIDGKASFKKFLCDFKLQLKPNVITSNGGYHCYVRTDGKLAATKFDLYPGVEFFGGYSNRAIPIPGSSCNKEFNKQKHTLVNPIDWSTVISVSDFVNLGDTERVPASDLKHHLLVLKNYYKRHELDYDKWWSILAALHEWDKGDTQGLRLAINFSKGLPNYKGIGDVKGRYNHNRDALETKLTARSIIYESQSIIYNRLRRSIRKIDQDTDFDTLAVKVANASIRSADRETLVRLAKGRLKELDTPLPVGQVREKFQFLPKSDVIDQFRYNTTTKKLIDLTRPRDVGWGAADFNIRYPKEKYGPFVKIAASVKEVVGASYSPAESKVFHFDGSDWINTFRSESIPIDKGPSPQYKENIDRLLLQFRVFFDDVDIANHVLDFIACNRQNPGTKILWAPLLTSEQGMGKSFLARVCQVILGPANIKVLENPWDGDGTQFTDWQTDSILNVLEEFDLRSLNRSAASAVEGMIKNLITVDRMPINGKWETKRYVQNVTNYMFFTNKELPIHIEPNDRRFMVYACKLRNKEDFVRRLFQVSGINMTYARYWDMMYQSAIDQPEDYIHYFNNRDISNFRPQDNAPFTPDKEDMQKDRIHLTAQNDLSTVVDAVKDAIDTGARPDCNINGISSVCLDQIIGDIEMGGRTRHAILSEFGFYQKVRLIVKLNGKATHIASANLKEGVSSKEWFNSCRKFLIGQRTGGNGE